MSRIEFTDTTMDAVVKMVDGNPGAITALMHMMKVSPKVDPDSAFGAISPMLSLDTYGIYGSRIWMFYKDVCGQDPIKCLAVMRANQLGQLAGVNERKIQHAIDNDGEGLGDLDEIVKAVQEKLPQFAIAGD